MSQNSPDSKGCPARAKAALGSHPKVEEIQEFLRYDTFAYNQAMCRAVEGWEGHGVCEMEIDPDLHLNAQGFVMGGAIFTLADYAFAVASMCGNASSVSASSTIEFMVGAKTGKLTATCDVDRSGHRMGFYTTDVVNDEGTLIARVVTTCYHPVIVG